MNAIDLASLLCSRLCHDLLSPVGALNNGLELMADEQDPEMRERCLELLNESARASANKLKFFRLAFGAAGGFGDQIDTREAHSALEGLFSAEGRVELGWLVEDDSLPKGAIKLVGWPRCEVLSGWHDTRVQRSSRCPAATWHHPESRAIGGAPAGDASRRLGERAAEPGRPRCWRAARRAASG